MDSKVFLMDLPNEILNHILHHLLTDAKVNYGEAQTASELLVDPYRCKALCITEVNKKFFEMAWKYLNTNCSITYTYLPERLHEIMTQFHINQDGDLVEIDEFVSFRQVTHLTIQRYQEYILAGRAKNARPLLLRFPNLRQVTLQFQEPYILITTSSGGTQLERLFRWMRNCDSRYGEEANRFLHAAGRHGLLTKYERKIERKVNIRFNLPGNDVTGFHSANVWEILSTQPQACVATVTKRGTEVLSIGYGEAALWKDFLDDIFNLERLPGGDWRGEWQNGGSRYAKWATVK